MIQKEIIGQFQITYYVKDFNIKSNKLYKLTSNHKHVKTYTIITYDNNIKYITRIKGRHKE